MPFTFGFLSLSVPPSDRTRSQNAVTALSQLRAAATAMVANFNVKYDRRRFVIAFITVPSERPPSSNRCMRNAK